MAFRVICISHTDGSGGSQVGRAVAGQLGYRYVDEELIVAAAREARVDPAVVAATEKKQSLLRKIMDALSTMSESLGPATLAAGLGVPTMEVSGFQRTSRDDLRSMIRAAILEVEKAGNAVIVAHAASLALGGREGVLRVLVTAPEAVRAERIANASRIPVEQAADIVEKGDAGRREYMRVFYDIEGELPTHYDMVLSTEVLMPEDVARLVVSAARG